MSPRDRTTDLNQQMLSKNAGLQMSYSDSYNRIAAQKRLKDYEKDSMPEKLVSKLKAYFEKLAKTNETYMFLYFHIFFIYFSYIFLIVFPIIFL